MDGDWSLLPKLLLGLVHLADEVDEALARLGHPLLRPVRELELPDGARLPVLHTDVSDTLAQQPGQRQAGRSLVFFFVTLSQPFRRLSQGETSWLINQVKGRSLEF